MRKQITCFAPPRAIGPGFSSGREIIIETNIEEEYAATMAAITNPVRGITDIVVTDLSDVPPPPDTGAEIKELREQNLIVMETVAEIYEMILGG